MPGAEESDEWFKQAIDDVCVPHVRDGFIYVNYQMRIVSTEVIAPRRLTARWTAEVDQTLYAGHSVGAEASLVDAIHNAAAVVDEAIGQSTGNYVLMGTRTGRLSSRVLPNFNGPPRRYR